MKLFPTNRLLTYPGVISIVTVALSASGGGGSSSGTIGKGSSAAESN